MLTDYVFIIARLLLAAVFGVAAWSKLTDRDGSRQAFVDFGVPAGLAAPSSILIPALEVLVAVALVPDVSNRWGALGALVLLLVFTAGITFNLARGRRPACHCFGELDSAPIGWQTLVRNAVLASVASLVIAQEWLMANLPIAGRLNELTAGQAALIAGIIPVLSTLILVQSWLVFRLVKRVHAFESPLRSGNAFSSNPAAAGSAPAFSISAPAFRLKNLDGEPVTLDQLRSRGKPVLLAFIDPDCRACMKLLPEAGRWQREHAALLTVVIITQGTPEANKSKTYQYGLTNVLLQVNNEISVAYRIFATPSGVLVGQDGNIASPTAWGRREIGLLVQSAMSRVQQAPESEQEISTLERKFAPSPTAE